MGMLNESIPQPAVAPSDTTPSVIHAVRDERCAINRATHAAPAIMMPTPTPAKTAAPSQASRRCGACAANSSRHHDEANTSTHALAAPATARHASQAKSPAEIPIASVDTPTARSPTRMTRVGLPRRATAGKRPDEVAQVVRGSEPTALRHGKPRVAEHHREDRREREPADPHRDGKRGESGEGGCERSLHGGSLCMPGRDPGGFIGAVIGAIHPLFVY